MAEKNTGISKDIHDMEELEEKLKANLKFEQDIKERIKEFSDKKETDEDKKKENETEVKTKTDWLKGIHKGINTTNVKLRLKKMRVYDDAYQKVVQKQMCVWMSIARINFVGLPRSGKTCTLRRLMGQMINLLEEGHGDVELPSTGIAERRTAFLRNIQTSTAISKSMWSSPDLLEQIGTIFELAHVIAHKTSTTESELEHNMSTLSSPTRRMGGSNEDEIFSFFNKRLTEVEWDKLKFSLQKFVYLINTDTGGQTEFLDLMSRFIVGPALNLIVSRLTDSFNTTYKIYCTNEEGESTEEEDSVVTLEDIIFQALASIASMKVLQASGDPITEKVNANIEMPNSSSKVVFVGTFKDQVSDAKFMEKDRFLQKKIRHTHFYTTKLVEYASDKYLIMPLDNLEGLPEEIDDMKETIEKVIRRNIQKVHIPITWLMLSLNIQLKKQKILKLEDCQALATNLGIANQELQAALWFLHYHVGILLYYPEVEGFHDIVICDIQVIFETTTLLIKKTFIFKKVGKQSADEFKKKGRFSLEDLRDAASKNSDDLIPLEKLVKLLEHHKILVKLPSKISGKGEVTYFMPCVLKSATPDELLQCSCSEVAPLMIIYDGGYVPLGIFCSMVINLMSVSYWELNEEKLYRNKIQFSVGDDYITVTLIGRPTYLEVVISDKGAVDVLTGVECNEIREQISTTLKEVAIDLNYNYIKFEFGFDCPHHPGEHLCLKKKHLHCLKDESKTVIRLEETQHIWFDNPTVSTKAVPRLYQSYVEKVLKGKQGKLYSEIKSDQHIRRVAEKMTGWEEKYDLFNLSRHAVHDITNGSSKDRPALQRMDVLHEWKKKAPDATYDCLLQVLVEGGFTDCATEMVDILNEDLDTMHIK